MPSHHEDILSKLKRPDLYRNLSFVHGEWTDSESGGRFDVIDPGTSLPWTSLPICTPSDVPHAIESSQTAFLAYRKLSSTARSTLLSKWYALIQSNRDDIAHLLVLETGKPLAEAHGEIDYAASFPRWFAGEAERVRGSNFVPAQANRRVMTINQPIGVAVALVPWNFPIAMVLRKASAALAAGCTMVVKPSPETPVTCLVLAKLAIEAGFPPGALNVLTTDLENTSGLSEALIRHDLVKKVSFTGSTRVGKIVAGLCAEGLKKATLELGGNCPVVVFDDADLETALGMIMGLKWRHAGQACISANRIYVQAGIYEKFLGMMLEKTMGLVVGHGLKEGTTMGPVTTMRGIEKAIRLVEDAKVKGGNILLGGNKISDQGGYFFQPTILTDLTPEMEISREEIFAPVCTLYKFETEEEVIRAANDTSMGLASYAFTKNVDRVWRLMEELEAGMVALNTGNSSAAESPFGGMKMSGYGKESGKDVAIAEYLVTKTVTLTIQERKPI